MYEIGSELHAVSEALPQDVIVSALGQLEMVEARYAQVLDGSGADITGEIRSGLAEVRRALEEAGQRLHIVRENTARYLAAIGLGDAIVQEPSGHSSSFARLNDGRPHTVARTEINAKLHDIARSDGGIDDIVRVPVPDDQVRWDASAPDYNPPFVDMPRGLSSARRPDDRPDPADPSTIPEFRSLSGEPIARDAAGRPLNPAGRTGMSGRGMLNKWGENPAADLILTRENPQTGELEVVAIQRSDTDEWALPGGKVDDDETARQTAEREFSEEGGGEGFALGIEQAREIYAGYVDDSRNTDNAWMATTAFHRHLDADEAQRLVLAAGSDARAVAWTPVTAQFFASHGQLVRRAVRLHRQQQ
jgi:ADP-ribose pyrophosphatase